MTKRIPKKCRAANCGQLSSHKHGYCDAHTSLQWANKTVKTAERGYGGKWQKLRVEVLKDAPFCTFPGCKKFADEVDHIDGDTTNTALTNLRPYCRKHHGLKTKLVDNPSTKNMSWERWEEKFKRDDKI